MPLKTPSQNYFKSERQSLVRLSWHFPALILKHSVQPQLPHKLIKSIVIKYPFIIPHLTSSASD